MTRLKQYPRAVAERIAARRADGWSWDEINLAFDIASKAAQALLERYGIKDDYKPALDEQWERPCLRCGSTEKRRRWLFRCSNCRRLGNDEYNAADSMYVGSQIGS